MHATVQEISAEVSSKCGGSHTCSDYEPFVHPFLDLDLQSLALMNTSTQYNTKNINTHTVCLFRTTAPGGAKQTGGSGRTSKESSQKGGAKSSLGMEKESGDRNAEKRQELQLQMMSRQLATSVKAALLAFHTEAEFQNFNIQMPDPESAMRKLKLMKEFTMKWYDKDFREEWLLRSREVWENELQAEFEAALKAVKLAEASGSKVSSTDNEPISIEELEAEIKNLNLSAEERKKLKNKLKKKRQKQKKDVKIEVVL